MLLKNIQKKDTKLKNLNSESTFRSNSQKLTKERKNRLNDNKLFHRSLEAFSDCV